MKKILKITAIILVIALFGLVYYYFFFAKKNNANGNNPITSIKNIFPFGQGSNSIKPGTIASSTPENPVLTQTGNYLQKLRLISNEPVAGSTFVETTAGVLIRYMEKATGHIFDVATYSPLTIETSNTTIPKIHEAFFTEGGTGVIARYIDTANGNTNEAINTIYGKISSTTAMTQLPDDITFVSVAPSGKNIFYLIGTGGNTNNGSTGILASPNTSNKKQIWVSPISHFIPQFINDNQIILTTNPNATAPGSAYIVNTKTASTKNILSQLPDLSILANPTGTLLVSYSSLNNGELFTYSLTSTLTKGQTKGIPANTSTSITPLTFPEKCVFDQKNIMYCAVPKSNLDSNSLDNWYLGLVSYSDDIWKYDLANNTSTLIEDLSVDAGRDIDATHLHINSSGSLITFENKTDGSLWSLNVTAQ